MRLLRAWIAAVSILVLGGGCSASRQGDSGTPAGAATPSFGWVFDGANWQPGPPAPALSAFKATPDRLSGFNLISCPAPAFCMVGGSAVRRTDGFATETLFLPLINGKWSPVERPPGTAEGLSALSCATANLCVGLGSTNTYMYDGRTWTIGPRFAGNLSRTAACAPGGFCLELQPTSYFYETFNGGRWSPPTRIGPLRGSNVLPGLLSCTSPTFCLGVSNLGYYWTFDGQAWSAATRLPQPRASYFIPQGVSCANPHFCVAIASSTLGAEATFYDGTRWTAPGVVTRHSGFTYFASISCPSDRFCMAVGSSSDPDQDFAISYRDGLWTAPTELTATKDQPAVSCASESQCLATTGAVNP